MQKIGLGISINLGIKGLNNIKTIQDRFTSFAKIISSASKKIKVFNSELFANKNSIATKLTEQNDLIKKNIFNLNTLMKSAAIGIPIKTAIDFESAMADVSKVVDFVSKEEERFFANQIQHLTRDIPLAATELASITASGGQMGIAKEELIDFTTIVAKMSTAFDMSADEAGDSIAKLMNIYGLGIKEAESLGDAMNHLSDNSASKARDIITVLNRIGGNSKVFGLASEEAAALSSAFLSLGKTPEIAGTAINALLSKLATAPSQGKAFQDVLQNLGMDAEYLKLAINEDAQGALRMFLGELAKIDKQDQMEVFSALMGANFADDLALLVGGLEQYDKALTAVTTKTNYVGSMQREFVKRSETTANQLQLTKNSIFELANSIGSVLLPPINTVLNVIKKGINTVAGFTEKHQTLTKIITYSLAGWIALKLAIAAVIFSVNFLVIKTLSLHTIFTAIKAATAAFGITSFVASKGIAALGFVTGVASKGFILLGTGIRLAFVALLTTPVGWIITGITAVIAIAVWAYNKFDWFKSGIESVWEGIKTIFKWSPFGLVSQVWGKVFDWLGSKFGWIKDLIDASIGWVGDAINTIKGFFGKVKESFGFSGGESDEGVSTKIEKQYSIEPAYNNTPYSLPATSSYNHAATSSDINVNFSGDFLISSSNGKFDMAEFEKKVTAAVKKSIKTETQNYQNRRIDDGF